MEIVNIQLTAPVESYQNYDNKDLSLIQTARISRPFGQPEDYIEYFIYDVNGDLLTSNYFVSSYSPTNPDPVTENYTTLQIDPEGDIRAEGFDRGAVTITYNFFRKLFRSSITEQFWIKEISSDRTEIRVARQDLSNLELQQAFNDYDNQASIKAYYPDFYLNFGDNNILIGVNVLYALLDGESSLLIKLYEPLADTVELKDTFWIVDRLSDSVTYEVAIEVPAEITIESNVLRGPNYNVNISEKVGQTTPLYNYNTLLQTDISASYQQLKSLMEEKGLDINVDYTDFNNYVHFSSAVDRIYNYVYKLTLLESYQADINALGSVSGSGNVVIASGSKQILQNKIDSLIEAFDGYEYYLYYESGSTAWPKSTSTQPYSLYSVTSSEALNWLGSPDTEPSPGVYSILYSASLYDINNKDAVLNTIPAYLKEDAANQPYTTFLNMVGQHFDNIWIYLKDVTERFDAENNLIKGISKDLVGEALKGLGINLYTNTSISDSIYYSMLGINQDGSLQPPTGSEKNIDYYISSSNQIVAGQDITLEYYKRIYHNLPYLLKTRGTAAGLRALINCFGIPDTILRVNEFGGSDKLYSTSDLIQSRHALAFDTEGTNTVQMPWAGQNLYYLSASNSSIVPDTVEFRFKTKGVGARASQSLFEVNYNNQTSFGINLLYSTASAIPSSSLQYNGDLSLYLSGSSGYAKTQPITLPFFNKELWWNVMIKRETGSFVGSNNSTSNRYWVYVKGAGYNEEGNSEITYEGSQSIYVDGTTSSSYNSSWNTFNTGSLTFNSAFLGGSGNNGNILSPTGNTGKFDGYFQEFRYWAVPLPEEAFDEHVQNSLSYRSSNPTSSLYDLTFRAPLGSNLNVPYEDTGGIDLNLKDYDLYELGYTTLTTNNVISSYHPAITGSFTLPFNGQRIDGIGSFISASTTVSYGRVAQVPLFVPDTIIDLIPTPSTGPNQKVNNKVNIPAKQYLSESLLSPHVSVQVFDPNVSKTSPDIEVGFAPSDNLDLDITSQLGYFNIDEYIGNPRDAYQDTYEDLSALRTTYYQKYLSSYSLWDFIRLIKYYDNSLFKMIKDYVPARANLSTGIIVKPTILERPKYPRHEPIAERENNYSGSIEILTITGSNPEAVYLDTAYTQSIITPLGVVTSIQTDLREPFTGEFNGSTITATTGLFPQTDVSTINGLWTSSVAGANQIFTTYSLDPLLNNVSGSRRSVRFLEPDYSSNINIPVNNNLITGALALYESRSVDPLYQGLNSPYWPFAEVQDYFYQIESRKVPRYEGSKTVSRLYSTYSVGDSSYGKTAAIDKLKYQYAYLVDIYTASLFLPGRSDSQIKYLIDNNENTLNLTKANPNVFEIQNVFKSGEFGEIALFDYDPTVPEVQLLTNNNTLPIYEGGFKYVPMMYSTSSATIQGFYLTNPLVVTVTAGSGINPGDLDPNNFNINYSYSTSGIRDDFQAQLNITASSIGTFPADVQITLEITTVCNSSVSNIFQTITLPAGSTAASASYSGYECPGIDPDTGEPFFTLPASTEITLIGVAGGGGGGNTSGSTSTFYTTYVTSSQPCIYYISESNQLVLNSTVAQYHNLGITCDSSVAGYGSSVGVEKIVIPFTPTLGDRVCLYNSQSLGWDERFEYTILNTSITGSGTGSRYLITLSSPVNLALFQSGSAVPVDSVVGAPYRTCNYAILKHQPDETNLILRYNPKVPVTQDGLIYPQYLDSTVKANAGNVVQSLKANNLI